MKGCGEWFRLPNGEEWYCGDFCSECEKDRHFCNKCSSYHGKVTK